MRIGHMRIGHIGLTSYWLNLALLYCRMYVPVRIFTLIIARLTSRALWETDFQYEWTFPIKQSCRLRYARVDLLFPSSTYDW